MLGLVAPDRRTAQVVTLRVLSTHQLAEEQQIAAGFLPLTAKPLRPWEDDNHAPS
jgi:hypothetical protein